MFGRFEAIITGIICGLILGVLTALGILKLTELHKKNNKKEKKK